MSRGRHSYPRKKCICGKCGWKGIRSTFMMDKKCPKCRVYNSVKERLKLNVSE